METSIKKAVSAAGGQSALARALGVSPQAVQQWVFAGRVSHKKVIDVEKASGVSRFELRPDLYPPEDSSSGSKMSLDCMPIP
jgi:DNA-binding transcriptional regulator YdaS (Cro superfamily)